MQSYTNKGMYRIPGPIALTDTGYLANPDIRARLDPSSFHYDLCYKCWYIGKISGCTLDRISGRIPDIKSIGYLVHSYTKYRGGVARGGGRMIYEAREQKQGDDRLIKRERR